MNELYVSQEPDIMPGDMIAVHKRTWLLFTLGFLPGYRQIEVHAIKRKPQRIYLLIAFYQNVHNYKNTLMDISFFSLMWSIHF